jgi:hypothetical protein
MLAKGLERVFWVVYALIVVGTAGVAFLQEPPSAPRYWGGIFLVGALFPLAVWPWLHRQFCAAPVTTAACGLLSLWMWSHDTEHGRFDTALILIPIFVAVAWAIRGFFPNKEAHDESV